MRDETVWDENEIGELEQAECVIGGCNRVRQPISVLQGADGRSTVVAIASASSVILMNPRLIGPPLYTLQFSEAFPSVAHKLPKVQAVSSCFATQRIAAVAGSHVAVWTPKTRRTWKIHSIFRLNFYSTAALHINKDTMVIAGEKLTIWKLDEVSSALPHWKLVWEHQDLAPITAASLSPCGTFLATTCKGAANILRIWSISQSSADPLKVTVQLASELWHQEAVSRFSWKESSSPQRAAIFTETSSGIFRIFAPQVDERMFFALSAAINHPYSAAKPVTSVYLDATKVRNTFVASSTSSTPATSASSDWDYVVTFFQDGSVGVVEVSNVSQSPVRCVQQRPVHFHPGLNFKSADARRLAKASTLLHYTLASNPSLSTSDDDRPPSLSILATNQRTGGLTIAELPLSLLRRPAPQGGRVRHWRHRPTSEISRTVRSSDGRFFVTLSKLAAFHPEQELVLWQAKQQGEQILRAVSLASLHFDNPEDFVVDASVWTNACCLLCQSGKVQVYQMTTVKRQQRLEMLQTLTPGDLFSPSTVASWIDDRQDRINLSLLSTDGQMAMWHEQSDSTFTQRPQHVVSTLSHATIAVGIDQPPTLIRHHEGQLTFASVHDKGVHPSRVVMHKRSDILATVVLGDYIALASAVPGGVEISIWDAAESEFKSGLEWSRVFSSDTTEVSLGWCPSPIRQPFLCVTFPTVAYILSHQRRNYFHIDPLWIPICKTSPQPYTNLNAALWIGNETLISASGPYLTLHRPAFRQRKQSVSLVEATHRHNGQLPLYHPQFLAQCLSAGKLAFVEQVLRTVASLVGPVSTRGELDASLLHWVSSPIFTSTTSFTGDLGIQQPTKAQEPIFYGKIIVEEAAVFSNATAQALLEDVHKHGLPELTADNIAHFNIIVNTVIEVGEHRRALDNSGLRYLIAMRSFFLSQSHQRALACEGIQRQHGHRLRYREIVWAFHSESQEILLQDSIDACTSKITWLTARALGTFLWLRSRESLAGHMEEVARNIFTAGDDRNPVACSLFYFALRKRRLVHGLWKQSYGHPDRPAMVRFLDNDFDQPKWRTAALKNAYALLSKQRFDFAAAFFLLGDSLRDAVNVCIRQLDDFQLAIAISRVYEGDSGPVLRNILEEYSIPYAIQNGYRWLSSWSFWMLGRRDLAIRVIVTPFTAIASSLAKPVENVGDPKSDDPSLAILYDHLRRWSLQTLKGASQVAGSTEFNFVLYIGEIYRELGCHWLALELVKNWDFPAPPSVKHSSRPVVNGHHRRRSSLLNRRQSLIKVDVEDIPSTLPSRNASPVLSETKKESDSPKDGNSSEVKELFKKAKQVAEVPEFDASAFGF